MKTRMDGDGGKEGREQHSLRGRGSPSLILLLDLSGSTTAVQCVCVGFFSFTYCHSSYSPNGNKLSKDGQIGAQDISVVRP